MQPATWSDIMFSMAKTLTKSRRNSLHLTQHAKQRLSDRGLWPVLGQIANIAHHPCAPRFRDLSSDGRPVERVEMDGVCLIIARPAKGASLTLLTVHAGSEDGPRARARIIAISRNLNGKKAA